MLWHRLWIVLVCYGLTVTALQVCLAVMHASTVTRTVVNFLLALLIGFEAGTLRRFTLARRGYRDAGIVVGDDLELAERRFFDNWTETGMIPGAPPVPPASTGARGTMGMAAGPSDVIGLFPEAGASR
jgi:hypothetical protein